MSKAENLISQYLEDSEDREELSEVAVEKMKFAKMRDTVNDLMKSFKKLSPDQKKKFKSLQMFFHAHLLYGTGSKTLRQQTFGKDY